MVKRYIKEGKGHGLGKNSNRKQLVVSCVSIMVCCSVPFPGKMDMFPGFHYERSLIKLLKDFF